MNQRACSFTTLARFLIAALVPAGTLYGGGAPPNDNCGSATPLTVGACLSGTPANSTIQSGEPNFGSCGGTAPWETCPKANDNLSVWYRFTATNDSMWLAVRATSGDGYLNIVVYNTSTCFPTCGQAIAYSGTYCAENLNRPTQWNGAKLWDFYPAMDGNLVPGKTYLVQVLDYQGFGLSASPFQICLYDQVNNPSTCSKPMGSAEVRTTYPSSYSNIATQYQLQPPRDTFANLCFSFVAQDDTMHLNAGSQSVGCPVSGGGFNYIHYTLYNSSCGTVRDCVAYNNGTNNDCNKNGIANLSDELRLTGLTVGATYIVCWHLSIQRTSCDWVTAFAPYVVCNGGACDVFSLSTVALTGRRLPDNSVALTWQVNAPDAIQKVEIVRMGMFDQLPADTASPADASTQAPAPTRLTSPTLTAPAQQEDNTEGASALFPSQTVAVLPGSAEGRWVDNSAPTTEAYYRVIVYTERGGHLSSNIIYIPAVGAVPHRLTATWLKEGNILLLRVDGIVRSLVGMRVELLDVAGSPLFEHELAAYRPGETLKVPLKATLPPGVYLVRVLLDDNSVLYTRIVKAEGRQ